MRAKFQNKAAGATDKKWLADSLCARVWSAVEFALGVDEGARLLWGGRFNIGEQ